MQRLRLWYKTVCLTVDPNVWIFISLSTQNGQTGKPLPQLLVMPAGEVKIMHEKAFVHGAVAKHLSEVAGQLAVFLERVLPLLYDDWWEKAVVSTLSFQKKRRLEQRNITSLSGLDPAGLLRVSEFI